MVRWGLWVQCLALWAYRFLSLVIPVEGCILSFAIEAEAHATVEEMHGSQEFVCRGPRVGCCRDPGYKAREG